MAQEITTEQSVRHSIVTMRPEFAKALPKHVPVERFERVALTAVNSSPDLLKADRTSLFAACVKAAQVGLLPDGREAALVTFGGKVQFMPMVAGIMKLVRNSGELLSMSTACVRTCDQFEHWTDEEGEHFKHVPNYDQQGDVRLVYAFAKTKDGGRYLEVMSMEQVNMVRAVSRSKDSGPWKSWPDEMARKTVFRRLSKRLPMSTDLDDALRADDELYDLDAGPAPARADAPQRPTRLQAVASKGMAGGAADGQPEAEHIHDERDNSDDLI